MTAPKLVLHPAPETAADPTAVVQTLRDQGLIGASFTLDGRTHFRTGPDFLEHISFLGCSPAIELDPPPVQAEVAARTGRFCHLQLSTTATPRLRLKQGHRPRCRRCRTDIDPMPLPAQPASAPAITCPGCREMTPAAQLNWRQAGGLARIFLDIWGIHTAEAVPTDRLLDELQRTTGGLWAFFYIED